MSRKRITLLILVTILILGGLGLGLYLLFQNGNSAQNNDNKPSQQTVSTAVEDEVVLSIQSGDINKAREVAEKEYKENPSPDSSRLLAKVESSDGNHDKVIEIIESIGESDRSYYDYNILADSYVEAGNKEEAIKAYQKTIETWPEDDLMHDAEVEYFKGIIESLRGGNV